MPNLTQAETIGGSLGIAVIGYQLGKYWNEAANLPHFSTYDNTCYQEIVRAYREAFKTVTIPEQWKTETKKSWGWSLTYPLRTCRDINDMIQERNGQANILKHISVFGKFKAGILSDILSLFYHYKHNMENSFRNYRERKDGPQMMMWDEFIDWLLNVELTTNLNADSTKELRDRIDYFQLLQRTKYSSDGKRNGNTTIRTINLVLSRLESILSHIQYDYSQQSIPNLIENIKFRTQGLIDTVIDVAYYSSKKSKMGFNADTYSTDYTKSTIEHQKHRLGCLLKIVLEKLNTKIKRDPLFVMTPKIQDEFMGIFKKESKAEELIELNKINDLGIPEFITKKELQKSFFDDLKNLLELAVDLSIHRFTLSQTFEVVKDFGELWFMENEASSRALNQVLFIAKRSYDKLMDQTNIFLDKINTYLVDNRIDLNSDKTKPFFIGHKEFKDFRTNHHNSVEVAINEIQNKHRELDTPKKVSAFRKDSLLIFLRMTVNSIMSHSNFYNNHTEYQRQVDFFNKAIHNVSTSKQTINTPFSPQNLNEEQSSAITLINTGADATPMTNLSKILSIYNNTIEDLLKDTGIPQTIKNKKYAPLDPNELQPGALKDINDKFLYPYYRAANNVNWFFSFFEGQGWYTHGEFLILYQKLTISIRYLISKIAEINPERLVIEKFIRDNFLKTVKEERLMNQLPEITQPRKLQSIEYHSDVLRVTDGGASFFIDTAFGHEKQFELIKTKNYEEFRDQSEKQKSKNKALQVERDQLAEEIIELKKINQEQADFINDISPTNPNFTTQVH